jgi:hypothetical protein
MSISLTTLTNSPFFTAPATRTNTINVGRASRPNNVSNTATIATASSNAGIQFTKHAGFTLEYNFPTNIAGSGYNGFRISRSGAAVGTYSYTCTVTYQLLNGGTVINTLRSASITQSIAATSSFNFNFGLATTQTVTVDRFNYNKPLTVRVIYTARDNSNSANFTLTPSSKDIGTIRIIDRNAIIFSSNF